MFFVICEENNINLSCKKGWYAVCYHGVVIGGAKSDGTALKE